MECIFIKLAGFAAGASVIPLAMLQFMPARYTLSNGALAGIESWRKIAWNIPIHMLSRFGKSLRIASYTLWALTALLMIIGFGLC